MRRIWALPVVGVALLALAVTGAVAHDDDGDGDIKNHHHFREQSQKQYNGGNKTGSAWNMVAVGQSTSAARGFNGDVWVHEELRLRRPLGLPGLGDRQRPLLPDAPRTVSQSIDATDPAHPERVATLQNPTARRAEDVVVYTARFGAVRRPRHRSRRDPGLRRSRYEPDPSGARAQALGRD